MFLTPTVLAATFTISPVNPSEVHEPAVIVIVGVPIQIKFGGSSSPVIL